MRNGIRWAAEVAQLVWLWLLGWLLGVGMGGAVWVVVALCLNVWTAWGQPRTVLNAGMVGVGPGQAMLVHGGVGTAYPHPTNALVAAVSGDVVWIGPGTYYFSNWFKCPTNGAIIGAGKRTTVLVDCFTNGFPAPLIFCSDNGYIGSLTISNLYAESTPQSCLGAHSITAATVNGTGFVGYTNFVGENLVLYGASDTFYNRATNEWCSAKLYDSELHGGWDIVTAFAGSGATYAFHRYEFHRCTFIHETAASHGNAKDVIVTDASTDSRIACYWSTFYKSNGVQAVSDYFYNNNTGNSTSNHAEFYFCTFTNASPAANYPFTIGASRIRFHLCAGYLPTDVDNDGAIDAASVSYGTNVLSQLFFGGDSLGLGPSLKPASDKSALILSTNLVVGGAITNYNGDVLTGNGVGTIVATFRTNTTANVATNTYYTARANGLYTWFAYSVSQGSGGGATIDCEWADDFGFQTNTGTLTPSTTGARLLQNRAPLYMTNGAAFKFGVASTVVGTNIICWTLVRLQ